MAALVRVLWSRRLSEVFAIGLFLAFSPSTCSGFSLLGRYTDWMVFTNDYQQPGEIGGPMGITEGYRWNVPMVTYGFDQSFIDYFGSNGVAAVESAIQVINELPRSSDIIPANFPLYVTQVNYNMEAQALCDLQSWTLCSLIEQMGLAQPVRYMFSLRQWTAILDGGGDIMYFIDELVPEYILERNFDPETLHPSYYVNRILYSGYPVTFPSIGMHTIETFRIDGFAPESTTVADGLAGDTPFGRLLAGLTKDDVGGIKYLLDSTNIAFEPLLPDVHGAGSNIDSYVNAAWRGGVDKISFVPQPYDGRSGMFYPLTNRFVDTYLTNGVTQQQELERIVTQPDFLFCADDHATTGLYSTIIARTSTSNWLNNASNNGHPGGAGPGIIRPQVRIAFQKLGPAVSTMERGQAFTSTVYPKAWGSFDLSTNASISFPCETAIGGMDTIVRLGIDDINQNRLETYLWSLPLTNGQAAVLQTSKNLLDWSTCAVITNVSTVIEWYHSGTASSQRFFRAVPQ